MLAQNLKIFRRQFNLSQEELARKAGITYSTMIKIESGLNKNPTLQTLIKLSKALNLTIDEIIK